MTKNEDIIQKFDQAVIPTYTRQDIVLVKGKGTKVWDADGKVYLDFLTGISVCNVGHCHPAVVEAIQKQAEQLIHVSNLYYNENQGRLAEILAELSMHGKCFFCNSGAEANEALIKLARLWGHDQNRHEIITMRNSFHGRTLATIAATGQPKVQKSFDPLPTGFVFADFNDIDSVKAVITDNTAAILIEAIQGEGGIIPAQPDFMKKLRALCDEHGILLLCDEVQCGMGRTGHWFGFQNYDVEPDAFSMAKSLGSGYPIGALITNPECADILQPGKHGSTFGGSPLACAAALATIQVIQDENLLQKALTQGERFKHDLQTLKDKYEHLIDVRGMGLMLGLVLDQPAKPLEAKLMDIGLISLATAENVIRFLPPLNTHDNEFEEALEIIDDACAEWHAEMSGTPVAEQATADQEVSPTENEDTVTSDEEPVTGEDTQEPLSEQQSDDENKTN